MKCERAFSHDIWTIGNVRLPMAWSKKSSKIKNGKKREPFSELVVRTVSKRIDLTQFEGLATREGSPSYREAYYSAEKMLPDLIAELKRMYAREDSLLYALRIIRDDLDEAIDKGHVAVHATNGNDVTKIRNFANDASQ